LQPEHLTVLCFEARHHVTFFRGSQASVTAAAACDLSLSLLVQVVNNIAAATPAAAAAAAAVEIMTK